MAPRTVKAKKAVDINEAPSKGKGKEKKVPEPEADVDDEEVAPVEKKAKRGKKVADAKQANGNSAAAKKGKKKNDEEIVDEPEENEVVEDIKKVEVKEKPKGRGRGRKAAPKPEVESEEEKSDVAEEETKPTSKGRKRAPTKAAKEKTPEKDDDEQEEEKDLEEPEEEPEPKKAGRGKKNVGRKAKTEAEDKVEEIKEEPASKKRRAAKKEEKAKGDIKDVEDVEEEAPEPKPTKGKRGQKKAEKEKSVEVEEEVQDTGEPTSKRRRKPADDKVSTEETKMKAPAKGKAVTDYESIDFSNTSKNTQEKEWNFKIASWNVDGVRAWLGKGGLDYLKYEKPDILCLQELKCAQEKLPDEITNLPGYHAYWLSSDKDGYAGVGIYTTRLAISVQYGLQDEELDTEGRIITAEYEQFYLICTYVPNSGRKLVTMPKRLKWNEEFSKHVKSLDKKKPVIICGDMNVSHNEIDLTNPKTNRKNAGFTDEERSGMTELLGDGFVDTYRHLYPDKTGAYTFWTYMFNSRAKNVGWRLDYFIVSERLIPALCDNVIRDQVYGSDHCPISLLLHLSTADKPKEQ